MEQKDSGDTAKHVWTNGVSHRSRAPWRTCHVNAGPYALLSCLFCTLNGFFPVCNNVTESKAFRNLEQDQAHLLTAGQVKEEKNQDEIVVFSVFSSWLKRGMRHRRK